jgi:tRNA nucleotidyltransferase (CCA-adding enzyme)
VGGVVRDYFLLGIISKDIDIELHYREKLDGELRAKQWGKLALNLANDYEIERLAYDIIRVNLGGLEVEISPPRIEVFQDDSDKEHHNFDCELYSQLPVEKSFARRDFTINAMAIKYHPKVEAEFVDPFHGREHLDQKMLHYCGGNFYQDPVRLLRAIRFYFRLGFSFSTQLENELKRMKDGKLSDIIFLAKV